MAPIKADGGLSELLEEALQKRCDDIHISQEFSSTGYTEGRQIELLGSGKAIVERYASNLPEDESQGSFIVDLQGNRRVKLMIQKYLGIHHIKLLRIAPASP